MENTLVNNKEIPDVSNNPSVINSSKAPVMKIFLGVLFLLTIICIFLFFFLDTFARQRGRLFFIANLIASPVQLNNPRIVQTGAAYVFTGKISQVMPANSGVEITTDIPELPPLPVNQGTQVFKDLDAALEPAGLKDLAAGQEVRISVIYDLVDKNFYTIRIFIL